MGSTIDNCTRTVRMRQWTAVLQDCQACGKSNQSYCAEHGINIKTFYYWQNKLRKEAIHELERGEQPLTEFGNQQIVPVRFPTRPPGVVTIRKAGYTVEIADGTLPATIEAVLYALNRQC